MFCLMWRQKNWLLLTWYQGRLGLAWNSQLEGVQGGQKGKGGAACAARSAREQIYNLCTPLAPWLSET